MLHVNAAVADVAAFVPSVACLSTDQLTVYPTVRPSVRRRRHSSLLYIIPSNNIHIGGFTGYDAMIAALQHDVFSGVFQLSNHCCFPNCCCCSNWCDCCCNCCPSSAAASVASGAAVAYIAAVAAVVAAVAAVATDVAVMLQLLSFSFVSAVDAGSCF